ncbi:MAG: NAD(P)H-hydrate dehydratase [Thermodesulfobacteriota bacterium]
MLLNTSRVVYSSVMPEIDKNTIKSFGIPGEVLMENAGRTASGILTKETDLKNKKIVILCGPGNNGGDGFVAARYLYTRALDVKLVLMCSSDKLSGDALLNFQRAEKLGIEIFQSLEDSVENKIKSFIKHSNIIIDALFGTGLNSAPRGKFGELIDFVNSKQKYVMAIDIPSGTIGDTGQIPGSGIKADICTTFGFAKPAHYLNPGKTNSGRLFVCDIGIPKTVSDQFEENINILTKEYIKSLIPKRSTDSHKGDFGHLGIIAGSDNKSGAAVMCAKAAHRTGAGLVTLCSPESQKPVYTTDETMKYPAASENGEFSQKAVNDIKDFITDKSAIVTGPGMGTNNGSAAIIEFLLKESDLPLLIDADGLNILSEKKELLNYLNKNTILTPHPKEMSRLCGLDVKEIMADQLKAAKDFACKYNCILVLKTSCSVIAFPDGKVKINTTGNPGLATGGSGDILSGITGGFLAGQMTAMHAAEAAVFVHGCSADLLAEEKGPFGYMPGETADNLPYTFKYILR